MSKQPGRATTPSVSSSMIMAQWLHPLTMIQCPQPSTPITGLIVLHMRNRRILSRPENARPAGSLPRSIHPVQAGGLSGERRDERWRDGSPEPERWALKTACRAAQSPSSHGRALRGSRHTQFAGGSQGLGLPASSAPAPPVGPSQRIQDLPSSTYGTAAPQHLSTWASGHFTPDTRPGTFNSTNLCASRCPASIPPHQVPTTSPQLSGTAAAP